MFRTRHHGCKRHVAILSWQCYFGVCLCWVVHKMVQQSCSVSLMGRCHQNIHYLWSKYWLPESRILFHTSCLISAQNNTILGGCRELVLCPLAAASKWKQQYSFTFQFMLKRHFLQLQSCGILQKNHQQSRKSENKQEIKPTILILNEHPFA